jgi:hypothetical protein
MAKTEPTEAKDCCICGGSFIGWGNNPEPFKGDYACEECNTGFVTPARMCLGRNYSDENILALLQTFAELGKVFRTIDREAQPRLRLISNDEASPN